MRKYFAYTLLNFASWKNITRLAGRNEEDKFYGAETHPAASCIITRDTVRSAIVKRQ